MSYLGRCLKFLRSLHSYRRVIEALKSLTTRILLSAAGLSLTLVTATLVFVPFATPPIGWLPEAGKVETLLGTLLAAQAAIAALTLAVTLFVMQGVGARRDVDDRMYREYVRRSWVQRIFWSSLAAVFVTGAVLMTGTFIGGAGEVSDALPDLRNITLVAAAAFIANLVLAGLLFSRALHLAHPEQWWALRQDVNKRDVREAVQVFVRRVRRAVSASETDGYGLATGFSGLGEGSADEAIRDLLGDARRAMIERRQGEFRRSLWSIKELVSCAMNEIEHSGFMWGTPGKRPDWPPLRELVHNLDSFREEVIRQGSPEYVSELFDLDYWLISTGVRRLCGEMFTCGFDGYRKSYRMANRIGDGEYRKELHDRLGRMPRWLSFPAELQQAFPFIREMVRHQERLLSDAMHAGRPGDYEELHKGFEASFQFVLSRWRGWGQPSPEVIRLCESLERDYRIGLMGLSGRAIILADSGKIPNADPYLEVARGVYVHPEQLASDIAQVLDCGDYLRFFQWYYWDMAATVGSDQHDLLQWLSGQSHPARGDAALDGRHAAVERWRLPGSGVSSKPGLSAAAQGGGRSALGPPQLRAGTGTGGRPGGILRLPGRQRIHVRCGGRDGAGRSPDSGIPVSRHAATVGEENPGRMMMRTWM